jgi:hypothetical protein
VFRLISNNFVILAFNNTDATSTAPSYCS